MNSQRVQRAVRGAEIVSPLRHAVRLVHRDEAQRFFVHHLFKARNEVRRLSSRGVVGVLRVLVVVVDETHELLGRDVEHPKLAAQRSLLHGGVRLRRPEKRRELQTALARGVVQMRHLVLHQRDQRADHQRGLAGVQRRDLVAHGLARARAPVHRGVAAGDGRGDDVQLAGAERVVAEELLERCGQGRGERGVDRRGYGRHRGGLRGGLRVRRPRAVARGSGHRRGVHQRQELCVVDVILETHRGGRRRRARTARRCSRATGCACAWVCAVERTWTPNLAPVGSKNKNVGTLSACPPKKQNSGQIRRKFAVFYRVRTDDRGELKNQSF